MVPLRAALAPLYLEGATAEWSGVALRDTLLRARVGRDGKEFMRWKGDLLFTHKGVSGPTALGVSREVAEQSSQAQQPTPTVEADLLPSVTDTLLLERLRGEVQTHPRKTAAALVSPYLSARLVEPLLLSAGVAPATRISQMSKKSLNKLAATLKGWPLGSVRHVPLERGEVVAGGIALDEVDPQTMRSRIVENLYLCGEVLDIAGPVGGYNLQAAWSTGAVAGEAAAH